MSIHGEAMNTLRGIYLRSLLLAVGLAALLAIEVFAPPPASPMPAARATLAPHSRSGNMP
ncbi:MAG TPA: hypothetical protein VLB69_14195 [Rudaea sp.]|nr:hypothetical protein [Rudaea sp.]